MAHYRALNSSAAEGRFIFPMADDSATVPNRFAAEGQPGNCPCPRPQRLSNCKVLCQIVWFSMLYSRINEKRQEKFGR